MMDREGRNILEQSVLALMPTYVVGMAGFDKFTSSLQAVLNCKIYKYAEDVVKGSIDCSSTLVRPFWRAPIIAPQWTAHSTSRSSLH